MLWPFTPSASAFKSAAFMRPRPGFGEVPMSLRRRLDRYGIPAGKHRKEVEVGSNVKFEPRSRPEQTDEVFLCSCRTRVLARRGSPRGMGISPLVERAQGLSLPMLFLFPTSQFQTIQCYFCLYHPFIFQVVKKCSDVSTVISVNSTL